MANPEVQQQRIAHEIAKVRQELSTCVHSNTRFLSRISINVQQNTAIHLKHRVQTGAHDELPYKQTLKDALLGFEERIHELIRQHPFFVAWIDVSFDGERIYASSTTCENSVRLTAQ